MRAAILAVGTELLGTDRLDTNSLRLTEALRRYGVELVLKGVVGDDEDRIIAELEHATAAADVVLVSGGLGPTADDVTREAVARLVGRELVLEEATYRRMEERFRRAGRELTATNRKQAVIVEGGEVLPNTVGMAPGQRVEHAGSHIFLFPGVPAELEGLISSGLEPWLAAQTGESAAIDEVELKVACVPESMVEEQISPLYGEYGRHDISVLAGRGEVKIRVRAAGPVAERRARLASAVARLQGILGDAIFSIGEATTLEEVVAALLRRRGATVATGESCTGGQLAERFTRVPGSSAYFLGAVVAYTNELKTALLGVPAEMIAAHGAVSQPVAEALAAGARERLGATYGIGITGIAGPDGGSEEKPVGTVHLAIADAAGSEHHHFTFPFSREGVRLMTTQYALDLLRRRLLREADAE